MITTSEAIFIALIALTPPQMSSELTGSIYARPEGSHYKVMYISTSGKISAGVRELDIDKETGEASRISIYTPRGLEGIKKPYVFEGSALIQLSTREIFKKALSAIPDTNTYDQNGLFQIVRNKDDYEVIFPPLNALEPGSRGDNFSYIVHVSLYGDILKIIGPR